jgi:HD-GYP domain-containing protein (c-di-GMP phosphodiesterase class II)
VLGQRLGLEKRQLYELGLCGLLHDIGKARIDSAIINKPGALDEGEWQQMRLHPREGLLALFQLRGFAELPLRQMLAAYEHHMKLDLTGYPKVQRTRRPSLFTRVVSVVDTFDAVSSARSYRSRGWPPDKVLLNMRDEPGWGLDRVLVKAFITATGIYPVGTVVSLTDNSLAIVIAPNPETPDAPVVQQITDGSGRPLPEPRKIDLAAERTTSGPAPLHIRGSVDPAR